METFTTAREAKEYIIVQLLDDALRQGCELSEVERKMLYFSETGWTLPDMDEVNRTFEREYDRDKYELKIGELAHRCFAHIKRISPPTYNMMIQAERVLKQQDHYLYSLINYDGIFGEPGTGTFLGDTRPTAPWWLDRLKLLLTSAAIISGIMLIVAVSGLIFGFK